MGRGKQQQLKSSWSSDILGGRHGQWSLQRGNGGLRTATGSNRLWKRKKQHKKASCKTGDCNINSSSSHKNNNNNNNVQRATQKRQQDAEEEEAVDRLSKLGKTSCCADKCQQCWFICVYIYLWYATFFQMQFLCLCCTSSSSSLSDVAPSVGITLGSPQNMHRTATAAAREAALSSSFSWPEYLVNIVGN